MATGDTPTARPRRWTANRKLEVMKAVHTGLLSMEDLQRLHGISPEEFEEWANHLGRYGDVGLKMWHVRAVRHMASRRSPPGTKRPIDK